MAIRPKNKSKPFPWCCPLPPNRNDPAHQLPKFETEDGARWWRNERARMLVVGRNANPVLSEKLYSCSQRQRCGSAACPECMRQFRRWITGASMGLLDDTGCSHGTGFAITVVPEWAAQEPGKLASFDLDLANGRIRTALARSTCRDALVIGGWDFSFNSHSDKEWPPRWQPHLYLLFPMVKDKEELRAALDGTFPPSERNPRPIKIKPLIKSMEAITYAIKGVFKPRTSYIGDDGRCNTRTSLPLPPPLERELLTYLDGLGITDRMFLRNVRRRGCRLVACHREDDEDGGNSV